jgi:hypothetical protein
MQPIPMLSVFELARLVAEATGPDAVPLLQRLPPHQRVRVVAALVIVITCGGLLLIFIRASGKITRWYMNRPPRKIVLAGDPFRTKTDDSDATCPSEDPDRLMPPSDSK